MPGATLRDIASSASVFEVLQGQLPVGGDEVARVDNLRDRVRRIQGAEQ